MAPRKVSKVPGLSGAAPFNRAGRSIASSPSLPALASRSSSRRSARLVEIPDSDDFEEIIDVPKTKPVFAGVIIPSKLRTSNRNAPGPPSSISDSVEASDYETPVTSAGVTPAEIANSKRRGRQSVPAMLPKARAFELRQTAYTLSSSRSTSKKRRAAGITPDDSDYEDEDADSKLARKLQAEEYEDDLFPPSVKRRKGKILFQVKQEDTLNEGESDAPLASAPRRRTLHFDDEIMSNRLPATMSKRRADADEEIDSDSDAPLASTSKRRALPDADDSGSDRPLASMPRRRALPVRTNNSTDSVALDSESELSEFDGSTQASNSSAEEASDTANSLAAGAPGAVLSGGRVRHQRRREYRYEDPITRRARREREKLEKAHPEIVTMWDDLKALDPITPVPAAQPEHISRKLKSFQLEGLNWMIRQEQSEWKGGLLGDEMGMGKTIQAVSLIMSDYPAKSPTLVVVPPVALIQWQTEMNDYTGNRLKILIYHVSANPKCKLLTTKDLKKYNVIMVSYSGLESMYRKENKGWNRGDGIVKEDSILHSINYHRLILDEAHNIKQRTASVAKACFALKATYKWCLSGTPVQNRIGEFFSLLRFLEVVPFACYFCKVCPCKNLHWAQDENRMCTHCKHSGFSHVSIFNQEILNPITSGENASMRKTGLDKLRMITDRIMLRRMKRDHTSSMELPPKDVVIHNEFFGAIERDFSQSIMSNTQRQFDTYVSRGVMLNNYANIFGLIMQMRQVANHPDLILRKNAEGGQNVLVCCICDEPAEEAIRSRCRHEFCRECAKSYMRSVGEHGNDADCPKCHIPLQIDWDQPDIEQDEENVKKSSIINRIKMDDWTSSTKIEMLVYDLYKLRSKKQTHKSIVFSQFTSMLQLVQWRLQKSGFTTVLLDGSMTPTQRQKSIEHFMNNVDVEVFLVSLKAGGVALNLTEASRVFIIDPWWNPAAEWQSADRCHRIGQRRPCVITRLCIEDSVESRMVMLQEKKANMINGTINNDQVAMDKLTPEDLQFLFRG